MKNTNNLVNLKNKLLKNFLVLRNIVMEDRLDFK